jgi:N,N'-diacetylchitobiose transport system substrate-binding protein
MKARIIAALALSAALAVAASTAAGGTHRASAAKLVVWLQVDAQQNWPSVVGYATQQFKKRHPSVDVEVDYQSWGDHLTKFDAALAGGTVPDVIELGNTETTKYMAAHAFAAIKPGGYPNSKTWLKGLADSCRYHGKTYCVPYYAGARAVIYRKDLYRQAGIKRTPASLAAFKADGRKLMKKFGKQSDFSAVYFPGRYWYAAMSFVYDYGGLTALKSTMVPLSRASKRIDEAHPYQALVFAKGHVAAFIGNGWEWPFALDKKQGNPALAPVMGAYPMPSHIAGRYMPTFLGGSDLGIPASSHNKSLAADWIKAYTGTASERIIAKAGNIANTTTLLGVNKTNPQLAPFAKAAKYSWFVPTAPNWVNVENANVLKTMCTAILTNRLSVAKATAKASSQITKILNAKS